jgi:sulfide:quinone oxidoreductase
MTAAAPFKVLIAGGGPAAIEAVLALRDLAPDIHVEVLSPEPEFVYRPLSVVEPFARAGLRRYPLSDLESDTVTLRRDSVARVDPLKRRLVTDKGEEIAYDALLIATGASTRRAIPHALTFGGPQETELVHGLVCDLEGEHVRRLTFVAPAGATWTLPLYELALQTAERADDMCLQDAALTIVSHESAPLEAFGDSVSTEVQTLLDKRGIAFLGKQAIPASDRVVVLPELVGRRTPGLPADDNGFLPVDQFGRVAGTDGVWAAGDGTDTPLKQGGLGTQLADVAVRSIIAGTGRPVEVTGFSPVLRAVLIGGRRAWYLRRRLDGADPGQISDRPLWWPPTKIAGHYLAPYLDQADFKNHQPTVERDLDAARRRNAELVAADRAPS